MVWVFQKKTWRRYFQCDRGPGWKKPTCLQTICWLHPSTNDIIHLCAWWINDIIYTIFSCEDSHHMSLCRPSDQEVLMSGSCMSSLLLEENINKQTSHRSQINVSSGLWVSPPNCRHRSTSRILFKAMPICKAAAANYPDSFSCSPWRVSQRSSPLLTNSSAWSVKPPDTPNISHFNSILSPQIDGVLS